jgi:hypothetical protein
MFISDTVPTKLKSLSTVVPGKLTTYIYGVDEEGLYYNDMSRSLFGLTMKKSGWDCMRHLEILAAGALPIFPRISSSPPGALAHHPKKLYHAMLSFPGLDITRNNGSYVASFPFGSIDWELYHSVVL